MKFLVDRCAGRVLAEWLREQGYLSGAASPEPAPVLRRQRLAAWIASGAAAVLLVALAAMSFAYFGQTPLPPPQPMRLSAEIGADASLYTVSGPSVILSPDGTRLAFVAAGAGQRRRLYVRSLDQLQATMLSGTEDARNPFFSPDGQWIGFFADANLKKISVLGGAAVHFAMRSMTAAEAG